MRTRIKFKTALKGTSSFPALQAPGFPMLGLTCQICGKLLNNPQDPTSKAVGRFCSTCAEPFVEERKAANG